jgi:NTP pyrophosphatase (non-canonical NTP hydrolase)
VTSDRQQRVASFLDDHDLRADPAYRLLDLAAEVGELAADAAKSSEYGANEAALSVKRDELGDALFALYALADELDLDAEAALDESLAKYESRIDEDGAPGSDAAE